MRFGKEFERRKLRLYFSDGQVADGFIVEVAGPEDGDGFVFDSPGDGAIGKGAAVWARFTDLQGYEPLEG